MAFIKTIQIDFKEIEYELEESGKQIDWNNSFEGVQEVCYKIVNKEFVDFVALGGNDITRLDMFLWITERLLEECDFQGVKVIEIDEDGNPID